MTKFRKLGRPAAHRVSMLRTMVSQLVKHERIETTVAKAKEVRRVADNMVQLGKEGTLAAARHAAAFVRGDDVLHKLFTELAYRYNFLGKPETEQVGIQDYFGHAYELGMLHLWHILNLLTGKMNSERLNPQNHNHLRESLLIHGQSPVLANNGLLPKSIKTLDQKVNKVLF
ncbi:uncharacterized protein [Elaeis guineensis]|uniref:Uncharacterized protein LOC105042297 isoform X1 n=1 Tax=Elaeis guineensis var. tenera TaxID=51953 RepID=A0A6J0PHC1_ELAGV|nr:uncharacterized protein LOC105042297 isoform X1 [Elaeis guineensis]